MESRTSTRTSRFQDLVYVPDADENDGYDISTISSPSPPPRNRELEVAHASWQLGALAARQASARNAAQRNTSRIRTDDKQQGFHTVPSTIIARGMKPITETVPVESRSVRSRTRGRCRGTDTLKQVLAAETNRNRRRIRALRSRREACVKKALGEAEVQFGQLRVKEEDHHSESQYSDNHTKGITWTDDKVRTIERENMILRRTVRDLLVRTPDIEVAQVSDDFVPSQGSFKTLGHVENLASSLKDNAKRIIELKQNLDKVVPNRTKSSATQETTSPSLSSYLSRKESIKTTSTTTDSLSDSLQLSSESGSSPTKFVKEIRAANLRYHKSRVPPPKSQTGSRMKK